MKYLFSNQTKSGEQINYCLIKKSGIIDIPGVSADVCFTQRDKNRVRTVYGTNEEDLRKIAEILETGIGFRDARKAAGYAGRIKKVGCIEQDGMYFSEVSDAKELHLLLSGGNTVGESMEKLGFTQYVADFMPGDDYPAHGHMSHVLFSIPGYEAAMPSTQPKDQEGCLRSLYVRRADRQTVDMQEVHQLVNERLHPKARS